MMYDQNGITITEAEYEDVVMMSPYIRKADVLEIEALGLTTYAALMVSYEESLVAYTVKIKGTPVGMFGLNDTDDDGTLIWMVATDGLDTIRRRFVKHSRAFIVEALERYESVHNWVDARNTDTIRWLQWLGAKIEPATPYGIRGELFHHFSFTRQKEIVKVFNTVFIAPRKKIELMEKALMNHPDAIVVGDKNEPPLKHEFTDGMYTRTITLPKGMILTGKIHRHDHPNFLMKGKVEVYTEDKGLEKLEAPQIIMSKAGTKRVILTLEDTVWSTVHANPSNTRDLEELENQIIAPSYEYVIEYKTQEALR